MALHRAAYLHYTDRGTFTDGRILVVGPSTVFTDYIGRVLPGLGEDSVHLRAIGELFAGVTAIRRDSAEAARVKGDLGMVRVLTDLMWQTPPTAPNRLRLFYEGQVLILDADDLTTVRQRIRARCEESGIKPNNARAIAAEVLSKHLSLGADDITDRSEFQRFLHAWWPMLTRTQVLTEAADGWAVDDVPLLDELAELLDVPGKPKAASKPEWQLRALTSGTRLVETFVLNCGLRDGWQLFAPGLPTPIALAGQSIDNNNYFAAQRWAAVILREGHRVARWIDGFDPHGGRATCPCETPPLAAAASSAGRRSPGMRPSALR